MGLAPRSGDREKAEKQKVPTYFFPPIKKSEMSPKRTTPQKKRENYAEELSNDPKNSKSGNES
jgi:hypothetical protein